MKIKTVYLVSGTVGEYSDREDWPVAAFTKEERAKLFQQLLETDPHKYDPENSHRFDGYKDEVRYEIEKIPINPQL